MLDEDEREQVRKRLARVAGQVAGIQKMVDDDRYCVDVLTQIAAARAALAKVSALMLESHIQTCVASAFADPDPGARDDKVDELIRIFRKECK